MINYKIKYPDDEIMFSTIIEVRCINDGIGPTLQMRNPGKNWMNILWIDMDGELELSLYAADVHGLSTNDEGYIKIRKSK